MSKDERKEIRKLVEQHQKLIKNSQLQRPPLGDSESLEQPYLGEVVDTVTTYSIYEEPIIGRTTL